MDVLVVAPPRRARRSRCAAVWLAAQVGVGAVGLLTVPPLLDPAGWRGGFEELLALVASLVLAACAAWASVAVTLVAVEAGQGAVREVRPSLVVPPVLRRALLVACGVAVLGVAPAHATPGNLHLDDAPAARADAGPDGLPYPDRPVGGPPRSERPGTPDGGAPRAGLVVAAGDSLWALAEHELARRGHPPDDSAVARATRRLHALNRDVVGDDPDLLLPGQRLRPLPQPHPPAG